VLSRRARLASLIDRSGFGDVVLRLRRKLPAHALTVLTFHRVAWRAAGADWDGDVIDSTPDAFEAQLDTVARHFTAVGVDDILGFLDGNPLPPIRSASPSTTATATTTTTALPLLQKHGLRAVFFIATSYVAERRVFLVGSRRLSHQARPQRGPGAATIRGASTCRWPARCRARCASSKTAFALDLPRFLDELARAAGVEWTAELEAKGSADLLMDWPMVRALAAAGMDVESHTHTHRLIGTLTGADLADELSRSRAMLSAELGRPVRALAYPAGGGQAITRPQIREAVRAAGYQLAFSTATGVNSLLGVPTLDRFSIHRVCMDLALHDFHFRTLLAVPFLRP